jgi:hypothetical protein
VGGEQWCEGRVDVGEETHAGKSAKLGNRDGDLSFVNDHDCVAEKPTAGGGHGCGLKVQSKTREWSDMVQNDPGIQVPHTRGILIILVGVGGRNEKEKSPSF